MLDYINDNASWIFTLTLIFNAGGAFYTFRNMKKQLDKHEKMLINGRFVTREICSERHERMQQQLEKIEESSAWLTNKFFEHILKGVGEPPPSKKQKDD